MADSLHFRRREERRTWLEYCAACEHLEATSPADAKAYSDARRACDNAKSAWEIRSRLCEQAALKVESV